jgi:hypothetical protein
MSPTWTSVREHRPSTGPEPMDRWRGRLLAGLAVVVLGAVAWAGTRDDATRWVVVRDAAGTELARVALPASSEFTLRYRNSVYRSLAEERYRVSGGQLDLVELAADELAVLEEYSTAVGGIRDAPGSRLTWSVAVERTPITLPLRIQATALGERTLLIGEGEIALWRLVAGRDGTLVILTIEGTPA